MQTIRQQIVDKNIAALRRIKTINGFNSDTGNSVHEWRNTPFQVTELPALIFRDLDEPVNQASPRSPVAMRNLHCQVELIVSEDFPMTQVRRILADVEQAIGEVAGGNWDNLASNTRPKMARAVSEQNGVTSGGSTFEYYIDYATRTFNSYESLTEYANLG